MVAILSTSRKNREQFQVTQVKEAHNTLEHSLVNKNKSNTILSIGENMKPKSYVGVLDVSCISNKGSDELLRNLEGVFRREGIAVWKEGKYRMRCRKDKIEFELEIVRLELLRYIRLKLLQGNSKEYRTYINQILSEI